MIWPKKTALALTARGRQDQGVGLPAHHSTLAAEINAEHVHAQRDATNAIVHAVRCGELLLSVKASLKHGEFLPWVEQNCEFTHRTATAYMRGGRQIGSGFPISSLSSLFGPLDEKVAPADHADDDVQRPGGDDVQQPDHRDRVAGDADHVDNGGNPETALALQVERELTALLHAWDDASPEARERFVKVKSVEIAGALPVMARDRKRRAA